MFEQAPDKFLSTFYLNLERLKHKGDELAIKIQEKLRLVVSRYVSIMSAHVTSMMIVSQHVAQFQIINVLLLIRLLVVMVQLDGFLVLFVT